MKLLPFFITYRLRNDMVRQLKKLRVRQKMKQDDYVSKHISSDLDRIGLTLLTVDIDHDTIDEMFDCNILYQAMYRHVQNIFPMNKIVSDVQLRVMHTLTVDEVNDTLESFERDFMSHVVKVYRKETTSLINDLVTTAVYNETPLKGLRYFKDLAIEHSNNLDRLYASNEYSDALVYATQDVITNAPARGSNRFTESMVELYILHLIISDSLDTTRRELLNEGVQNIRNQFISDTLSQISDVLLSYNIGIKTSGRRVESMYRIAPESKDQMIVNKLSKNQGMYERYYTFVDNNRDVYFSHNPQRIINHVKIKTGLKYDS